LISKGKGQAPTMTKEKMLKLAPKTDNVLSKKLFSETACKKAGVFFPTTQKQSQQGKHPQKTPPTTVTLQYSFS
jgi:hypothetical protein